MAVFQRLAVIGLYSQLAVIAGRRISNVELTRPVRGDDTLTASVVISGIRPSKAGRSLISLTGRLHCEGVEVMSMDVDMYLWTAPQID